MKRAVVTPARFGTSTMKRLAGRHAAMALARLGPLDAASMLTEDHRMLPGSEGWWD